MAAIKERLRADLTAAMRAKDELSKSTLRMAIGAIQKEEVAGDTARELTEPEELAIVTKEVASRRDSAEAYQAGGRPELAERELAEVEVLLEYLPEPLTEDELDRIVATAIERFTADTGGAPTMRDMGRIMKPVTAEVAGRAPGAQVAAKVKSALG